MSRGESLRREMAVCAAYLVSGVAANVAMVWAFLAVTR
jgi:hypothetical protein